MNDGSFLVARVVPDSLGETLEWLGSVEPSFQPMDPRDFLNSAEIAAVYDLYKTQYLRIDARLNRSTDPGTFWLSRATRRRNMG